jgi:hypothetical protein
MRVYKQLLDQSEVLLPPSVQASERREGVPLN